MMQPEPSLRSDSASLTDRQLGLCQPRAHAWGSILRAGRSLGIGLALVVGTTAGVAQDGEGISRERLQEMIAQQGGAEGGGQRDELHPAVRALLEAPYLSEAERAELRVRHGVWTEADLEDVTLRARAALIAGAYGDVSLTDEAVPVVDRAEAALMLGEPERALELLAGEGSLRAVRIRAEALFDLARYDDADAAVQAAIDRMTRVRVEDAAEVAEGVRALMIRWKVRGPEGAEGSDYRAMTRVLAQAREANPLDWRVRLVEAELLYDKHNNGDAAGALQEVLGLCPKNAKAATLLGRLMTDAFDVAKATVIADEVDRLAGVLGEEAGEASSVGGAEVRARVLMRQRSPEAAAEALDAQLEETPAQRRLVALRAAASAAAFDDAARERWLERLEELSPGSALGVYEVGAALSEARQYAEAAGYLSRATERLPNWSQPWIELGLLQVQAGDDDGALAALTRAMELDPFDVRAANSLELVRELLTYEVLEGEHFAVRYKAGIDELLAREMLPVLDEIHERVAAEPEEVPGGLGHEPEWKTLIELMPNHRWFSVRITGMTRIHTIAAATGPVIAMESPQVGPGFSNGPFDWPRVLQHEYGHTVALSRTKNRVPHWFTEAASVELEDAPRDMQTWRLLAAAFEGGTLFDLDQINIAFVRPEKPTDRAQAYAQGNWMYHWILTEWGARAPLDLMDRYAEGEAEASAFEAELGVTRDEFMERFTAWAEADLREHGMLPAADAPTILEMIEADSREGEGARPDRAFVERWLSQFPGHPDLRELAARIALEESPAGEDGRLGDEVVEALGAYAGARPVDDWPHRLLARHYLSFGEDEAARFGAVEHLEFLDAREQSSIAYAAALARLYAERGEHEGARVKAERATRIAPFDADARELAARVALVAGDAARAKRHIEALAFLEPDREIHKRRLEAVERLAAGG